MSSDRAKFIDVEDLLKAIATGLGEGSKTLVDASKTELGTLAVKEGEVTVNFEMSSVAYKGGIEVQGLGVRTLQALPAFLPFVFGPPGSAAGGSGQAPFSFGAGVSEEHKTNQATITLKIVTVAPEPTKPADSQGESGSKGTTGWETVDPVRDRLREMIDQPEVIKKSFNGYSLRSIIGLAEERRKDSKKIVKLRFLC